MSKKNKILILLIAIILYIGFLVKSQDSDMYFIISTGKDILNGHWFENPHTKLPIVVQQWLYAIICAKVDTLGTIGHFLFVVIQNVLLWAVSYKFVYDKTNDKWKSFIGPIIATLLTNSYLICIRPQIITMILLVIQLIIMEKYKKSNNGKILLTLIPLSILSANLHQAIFLYHIFIMIPYFVDLSDRKIDWKLIISAPIMFLSTLCTPYGIDGPLYILKTFKSGVFNKLAITEIVPVKSNSYYGVLLLIVLFATILLIHYRKSNKYINFYTFSIFVLSLTSVRHVSILYIALLFILIETNIDKEIKTRYLLGILYLAIIVSLSFICKPFDMTKNDNAATNILNIESFNIPKDATIYHDMNLGGYLEYVGYENIVFDTRPELYTEELCGENRISDFIIFQYGRDEHTNQYVDDEQVIDVYNDYEYVISHKVAYASKILEQDSNYTYLGEDNNYLIWKQN